MGRGGGQNVKQVIMSQVKVVCGTDRLHFPLHMLYFNQVESLVITKKNPPYFYFSLPLLKLSLFGEYLFFFNFIFKISYKGKLYTQRGV